MIGYGYEGGDGIVSIARVRMEFDTVGEYSPHIQLNGAEVWVSPPTNGTADVT